MKGTFIEVPDVREIEERAKRLAGTMAQIAEWQRHQENGCPICAEKATS